MKLHPLSKADLFAEEKKANPYFNTQAAIDVLEWAENEDFNVVKLVMSDVISKRVRDIAEESGEEIEQLIIKSVDYKFDLLKKTITNGVINKSMSDDTVDATVEAVDIVKAFFDWRSRNAKQQRRGPGGRFASMGRTNIQYKPPKSLKQDDRDKDFHDQAVQQVKQSLSSLGASSSNPVTGRVSFTDEHGRPQLRTVRGHKAENFTDKSFFVGGDDRKKIDSIDWFDGSGSSYEDTYNLLNNFDGVAQAGQVRTGESGTTRNMRQLGAMSSAADAMGLGTYGGPKTQAALEAAKAVGEFGPQAEKYVGPSIRRLAYRYRGTERTPDEAMLRALTESAGKGMDQRGSLLMLGSENKQYSMEDTSVGLERQPVQNKFFKYFTKRLPNPDLINLQTESGAIAPSEGVIISREGKVLTQAVGYGDDHYLPFNFKKFSQAQGGDYVRTRTLGGLTTEDIYGGLIGGVRSMTVVSHSGTFTLEFDPTLRGGRRLNDKARRMSKKYGQLVDSLASKNVKSTEIPSDRRYELRQQAEREIPGDTPDIQRMRRDRYGELKAAEQENPTPSQETKDSWANEFGIITAEKYESGDNMPMTWERIKQQASMKAGHPIEDDVEAISVLGLEDKYNKFYESKERAYKRENSPLRLNGEGYRNALLALQEQFPYYIKEVNWIPPQTGVSRDDVGYVKPKHLRSENIKEGYHDPTVEGYIGDDGVSGKRTADRENYSNAAAYERLRNTNPAWTPQKRKKQGFNLGGGSSEAGSSTTTSATGIRLAGTSVDIGNYGPIYSGFEKSKHLDKDVALTDYDLLKNAMNIRRAMRTADRIPYTDDVDHQQKTFTPFGNGISYFNAIDEIKPLFIDPNDDAAFESKIVNGDIKPEDLRTAIDNLSANSASTSMRGALGAHLQNKGLLKEKLPENPQSAVSLATDLSNGLKNNYDFTREGSIDGMHYLPGLAKREYLATWNTDSEIQLFTKSAERRFGYDMTLNKHQSTFDQMSQNIGKAAKEALDATFEWKKQINQYGGVKNVPTKTDTISYGGKVYSIFGADDLQRDVAADVLAVAKATQLKRQYAAHSDRDELSPQNPKMKVISLEEVTEAEPENEFNEDVDPNDKLPFGVKFGGEELRTGTTASKEKKVTTKAAVALGDQKKLEEARNKIHRMVGLDTVKQEFDDLIKESTVNRYRESKGMKTRPTTRHIVFTGDPGTGKTTVAQELGKAYNAIGLIPTDNFAALTRADLVSPYQGQTAAKVRDVFAKNKGGVIFIDEAYALVNGPDDAYGYEAIDELVTQVENNRDDTVVILAGYPKEMKGLLKSNPGLKSRFPRTMHFPNYTGEEMAEIGFRSTIDNDYAIADDAKEKYSEVANKIAATNGMANARDVRNFNDALTRVHTKRMSKIPREDITDDDLRSITAQDIDLAAKAYFKTRTGSVSKRLVLYPVN